MEFPVCPILSIIVPVYKSERYIARCVESILEQDFCQFELILIDDGSPDDSSEICDFYAKKDERILVIHKENEGVSSARNTGLDIARGQYVTFIDSDDFVSLDYLRNNMEYLLEHPDVDMVILQLCEWFDRSKSTLITNTPLVTEEKKTMIDILCVKGRSACFKIAKLSLFEQIRFPVGKTAEGVFILPELISYTEKIYLSGTGIYYFQQKQYSIPYEEDDIKKVRDVIEAHIRLLNYLYTSNKTEHFLRYLADYSSFYMEGVRLFPDHDYSAYTRSLESFKYSYKNCFQKHLSFMRKVKLLLLKFIGFEQTAHIYRLYLAGILKSLRQII